MDVMNVDAGVDYRRRSLEQVQCYHTPLDERAQAALQEAFNQLADTPPQEPLLHIEHREIRALSWPARWCGSTSPRCAAAPLAERLPGSWPTASTP